MNMQQKEKNMGDWNEIDFVTRVPLMEGEEAVVLCGKEIVHEACDIQVKPKPAPPVHVDERRYNSLRSGECGFFCPDTQEDCVRIYHGEYDGYGRLKGVDIDWDDEDWEFAFMRKDTLLFAQEEYEKEMKKNENRYERRCAQKDMETGLERADKIRTNNAELAGIFERNGWEACIWANTQHAYDLFPKATYDKIKKKIHDMYMYGEMSPIRYMDDFEDNVKRMGLFVDRNPDHEAFERYAKDWKEVIKPLIWFLSHNFILPYRIKGVQAYKFDVQRRLLSFARKQFGIAEEAEKVAFKKNKK